jgi:aminopeptidase
MSVSQLEIPKSFPPFDLTRLLRTVFEPQKGERTCVLIDLDDPMLVKDFGFLKNPSLTVQKYAHDIFFQGLNNGVGRELGLTGGELYAYKKTGGSNLDMDDLVVDTQGRRLSFEKDIYPKYDIILCISTYSATAPLTASAKKHGFRGATLHGLNEIILQTGLAVDYNEVSRQAEKLRLGLTKSDWVEIDYEVSEKSCTLHLDLGGQEAQKSHGLCRGKTPDVANLPAGEVYFVPTGASGQMPMKFEDGTLAILDVAGGRQVGGTFLSGERKTFEAHLAKLKRDPVTGELGELGFGTQLLPFSGRDIQDEKVLGTIHVATGRSDHLGGHLTPDKFAERINATHDDILYAPHKTPEISVKQVRMHRDGKTTTVMANYRPAPYLEQLLA